MFSEHWWGREKQLLWCDMCGRLLPIEKCFPLWKQIRLESKGMSVIKKLVDTMNGKSRKIIQTWFLCFFPEKMKLNSQFLLNSYSHLDVFFSTINVYGSVLNLFRFMPFLTKNNWRHPWMGKLLLWGTPGYYY